MVASRSGGRSLAGKHALVTGATTPLARVLAVGLAEAGATVSVTTTHALLAEEVQANSILNECWAAAGASGQAKTIDLAAPQDAKEAIDALEREVAPIDILVNASYGAELRPVLEVTLAEWQMEIDDSVTTTFVACQAVGQRMIGRGAGRIINVVAIAHDRAVPNSTLFSASQAAVIGLTRALGVEWGRGEGVQGVMVNALGLGFYEETEGPNELAVDVQAALVYLATESTDDVQGEMLMVDGAFAEPGE